MRNDAGTLLYDHETACMITEKKIVLVVRGFTVPITIKIPVRILSLFKSEHWDRAEAKGKEEFERQLILHAFGGAFSKEKIIENATPHVRNVMCEFLYNCFIVDQADRGNEAWEVPGTMEKIGQRPEEDGLKIQ